MTSWSPSAGSVWAVHATVRCGRYAGLEAAELAEVMGGGLRRLLDRADLSPASEPPGDPAPLDPLLERAYVYLAAAVESAKRGEGAGHMLALAARLPRSPGAPAGSGVRLRVAAARPLRNRGRAGDEWQSVRGGVGPARRGDGRRADAGAAVARILSPARLPAVGTGIRTRGSSRAE
jgi:hypothetical protein